MHPRLNTFTAIALCLLLAATAQAAALARATAGPSGYGVICTGNGPVMADLDASGRPVSHHLCPDGALALFDLAVPAVLPDRVPAGASAVPPDLSRRHAILSFPSPSRARGPPSLS